MELTILIGQLGKLIQLFSQVLIKNKKRNIQVKTKDKILTFGATWTRALERCNQIMTHAAVQARRTLTFVHVHLAVIALEARPTVASVPRAVAGVQTSAPVVTRQRGARVNARLAVAAAEAGRTATGVAGGVADAHTIVHAELIDVDIWGRREDADDTKLLLF